MTDLDQYSSNFAIGMKVGVGIPLTNAEIFTDWAIIHEIEEDLVTLQLSRDQLPTRVTLHVGQILELQAGKEGNHYSCRAIIVSEGYAKRLQLRLIGEIVSDELREFYRIDAFLPIKYYISHEQNPELLRKQWDHRRETRFALEIARKQRRWDSEFIEGDGELPREKRQEEDAEDELDVSWNTIIPLAANISGGGLRMTTHQDFEFGEFVLLEILVPEPRRIVDAVVRVVFSNHNHAAGDDHEYFNVGLQFVFIDERDRDSIVNHISNVQLKRNRQLREKYRFRSELEEDEEVSEQDVAGINWAGLWTKVVAWGVLAAIFFILISYFRNYAVEHPKNEIGEMFENALKKYIEKQK
jgi:c-di-GMP-binding flagellar brake protein YcgR